MACLIKIRKRKRIKEIWDAFLWIPKKMIDINQKVLNWNVFQKESHEPKQWLNGKMVKQQITFRPISSRIIISSSHYITKSKSFQIHKSVLTVNIVYNNKSFTLQRLYHSMIWFWSKCLWLPLLMTN